MPSQRLVNLCLSQHQLERGLGVYGYQDDSAAVFVHPLYRTVYLHNKTHSTAVVQGERRNHRLVGTMALCRRILRRQHCPSKVSTSRRTRRGTRLRFVLRGIERIQEPKDACLVQHRYQADNQRFNSCSGNNRRIVQPQPPVALRLQTPNNAATAGKERHNGLQ